MFASPEVLARCKEERARIKLEREATLTPQEKEREAYYRFRRLTAGLSQEDLDVLKLFSTTQTAGEISLTRVETKEERKESKMN